MPTKSFFNLDEYKQEEILKSAKKEFSENLYENASINKIIKEINMPRGSFYLYFENKEDIYSYILETYIKNFKKRLVQLLNKNNHDIFETVIEFYDYLISSEVLEHNLIRNIFINMNSRQIGVIVPIILKKEVDGYIMNSIDFSKYSIAEEDKEVIMGIIFPLLFMSVGRTLSNICDKQDVRAFYIKQINIIKKGLERK